MVAGNGEVIRGHGGSPGLSGFFPAPGCDLIDPAPMDSCREIVIIFAGDLAGLAARAGIAIDKESILRYHRLTLKPQSICMVVSRLVQSSNYAVRIPSGGFVFHLPRVKSGIVTGLLLPATDLLLAPTMALHAAAS
jgi:hypothetical protein